MTTNVNSADPVGILENIAALHQQYGQFQQLSPGETVPSGSVREGILNDLAQNTDQLNALSSQAWYQAIVSDPNGFAKAYAQNSSVQSNVGVLTMGADENASGMGVLLQLGAAFQQAVANKSPVLQAMADANPAVLMGDPAKRAMDANPENSLGILMDAARSAPFDAYIEHGQQYIGDRPLGSKDPWEQQITNQLTTDDFMRGARSLDPLALAEKFSYDVTALPKNLLNAENISRFMEASIASHPAAYLAKKSEIEDFFKQTNPELYEKLQPSINGWDKIAQDAKATEKHLAIVGLDGWQYGTDGSARRDMTQAFRNPDTRDALLGQLSGHGIDHKTALQQKDERGQKRDELLLTPKGVEGLVAEGEGFMKDWGKRVKQAEAESVAQPLDRPNRQILRQTKERVPHISKVKSVSPSNGMASAATPTLF